MKTKTVILTGAGSYTGVEIANFFLNNGDKVIALIRHNSLNEIFLPKNDNLKIVYSDINEISEDVFHNTVATNEEIIFFNHAWQGVKADWNDVSIQKKNIEASLNAIEISKYLNCRAFIQTGSQAEYGNTGGEIITEEHLCNPTTEYGKAKLEVCHKAQTRCQQLGINFAHLRICSIYGRRDHPYTLIASAYQKMLNNEDIVLNTDGTQIWNYLNVADAGKMMGKIADNIIANHNSIAEIFNIASKDSRLLKDFLKEMKIKTQSTSRIFFADTKSNIQLNPSIEKAEKFVGNLVFLPFLENM
jgi:nucleoside-diphosphate-sugar epimerase